MCLVFVHSKQAVALSVAVAVLVPVLRLKCLYSSFSFVLTQTAAILIVIHDIIDY